MRLPALTFLGVLTALASLPAAAATPAPTPITLDQAMSHLDWIGNPVEPVLKITANPNTARTMSEHIDLDVSGLLTRELTLPEAGRQLMELVRRTACGRLTCAEVLGHREFAMTRLYRSA